MTMLVPLPTAPPAEVARRWLTNRQALFVLIALVAVLATRSAVCCPRPSPI
jgi:hypothetical protein